MKVSVTLDYDAALTKALTDSLPPGQAHWWLRKDSDFVRLPKRIRGDQPLKLVIQLEPGIYTLGVGPARGGVRENLEVAAPEKPAAEATTKQPKKKSSLDVKGKSFVITGDLDAMERDAAKEWLQSLGAKVSTSVSSKTDYLLVGHNPGPKKLEKAEELGTKVVSEAELRASLGLPDAPPPVAAVAPKPDDKTSWLERFMKNVSLKSIDMAKVSKLVGPARFRDLGLFEHELWGISIGPQGGLYNVYIDLKDRPKYAMRCNCREWNPCKHAYALLVTANQHFVPPAPPPDGHEEASRYESIWE